MRRKILPITTLLLLLIFATTVAVQAKNTKYTFNDVTIGDQIVEIEAGVKDNKNSDFSQCTYFSDDYAEALGYYSDAVVAGESVEEVLDFCVEHFDERTQ